MIRCVIDVNLQTCPPKPKARRILPHLGQKLCRPLTQWVHLMAAVVGLGGMGFLLLILIPSLGVLRPEQRDALSKAVAGRFRWASWTAMLLLLLPASMTSGATTGRIRGIGRGSFYPQDWAVICPLRIVLGLTIPLQIVRTRCAPASADLLAYLRCAGFSSRASLRSVLDLPPTLAAADDMPHQGQL